MIAIIRVIEDESCTESLLIDIDLVTNWMKKRIVKLDFNKCKMHIYNKNVASDYLFDDLSTEKQINLEISEFERDLSLIGSIYFFIKH